MWDDKGNATLWLSVQCTAVNPIEQRNHKGRARTSGLLNSLCLFASESCVPAAGHFLNMSPSAKCILYF